MSHWYSQLRSIVIFASKVNTIKNTFLFKAAEASPELNSLPAHMKLAVTRKHNQTLSSFFAPPML